MKPQAPVDDATMEITGPVKALVWASTDAADTDFAAVLIDVHPDGTAINLCEGIVRARHAGLPEPLAPGSVYQYVIDLIATSIVLPAGHRLPNEPELSRAFGVSRSSPCGSSSVTWPTLSGRGHITNRNSSTTRPAARTSQSRRRPAICTPIRPVSPYTTSCRMYCLNRW